jgi:hypothetical protein
MKRRGAREGGGRSAGRRGLSPEFADPDVAGPGVYEPARLRGQEARGFEARRARSLDPCSSALKAPCSRIPAHGLPPLGSRLTGFRPSDPGTPGFRPSEPGSQAPCSRIPAPRASILRIPVPGYPAPSLRIPAPGSRFQATRLPVYESRLSGPGFPGGSQAGPPSPESRKPQAAPGAGPPFTIVPCPSTLSPPLPDRSHLGDPIATYLQRPKARLRNSRAKGAGALPSKPTPPFRQAPPHGRAGLRPQRSKIWQ